MRRRAGVGAIQKKKLEEERYRDKGNVLAENQMEELSKQFDAFRTNLEEFARDHKQEIKKDPEFRKHFQVSETKAIPMFKLHMSTTVYDPLLGDVCVYWCRSSGI